jgi:uncharacterized protein
MHERIINMLNSKTQQTFGAVKAILPREFRTCNWLRNCYGGCLKDRIKDPEDLRKPRFCTTTKMFLNHADLKLKVIAEKWKEQQAIRHEKQRSGGVYNAFKDFVKE